MSGINNINKYSTMRLVGIATGLDTDTIVKQLMFVEKQSLYKLQRQKQLAEWKQEAYREFINALRGFKEKFFDITKRTSYMLSENSFNVFKVISSSDEYVTAKGTASAQAGSHKVVVKQLATAAVVEGGKGVSGNITTGVTVSDLKSLDSEALEGKTIKVTLDGVTKEIELPGGSNFVEELQDRLDEAFGLTTDGQNNVVRKIVVGTNEYGKIYFSTTNGASKLTLSSGSNDGLSILGIASGASNRLSTGITLRDLENKLRSSQNNETLKFIDENGNVSFTINGKTFTFSANDTLQKVMSTVNNDSDAKVTLSYDEIEDRFIITAKQTGAGKNINLGNNGNVDPFLKAILSGYTEKSGQDAKVEIDGVEIVRSSNTFTVNGIEYTLKKVHEGQGPATITVERDIDTVYNLIKSFVDEYNKLVDMFNTKLTEKYDRNYFPLTDDEKEELTEDEIKKWEEKAKTGLLRNDSILQQIQRSMRVALIDAVEGVGISLSSIGISSNSYLDKGKLSIDEDKLKAALRDRPDEVRELFIKTSDSVPLYDRDLTQEQRNVRYKEQGLLHRISDILNDYISTLRNKEGYKGILLEKAGMEGDLSQYESSLSKEIRAYEERINEMYTRLAEKEESYYRKFTELEKYMSQMNSQLSWLFAQLGVYRQ